MKFYLKSKEEVLKDLDTSELGLTKEQVRIRQEKDGKNKLDEAKKVGIISKFLKQLVDPMIIVLLAAAVISGALALYTHESLADVFIILFVVILNAVLGVIQESKAEKALDALKQMTAATSKVLRDGAYLVVKSEELVIGDIILLEAGDAIPADVRIIECASLKVEEASLTGESVPVNKTSDVLTGENIVLGDRTNMAYMGSNVVYGRAKAVVVGIGMATEMGKIANTLLDSSNEATPLQKKLSELSKILTYVVLGVCLFIFVFGIIKSGSINRESILDTFIVAVSLAVAAIPEGLATVVTIVLSIGVTKMSKHNAVIRKLTAVETLGCTQIICSDKTGTLTQNKMTVVKEYTTDKLLLAKALALASDATLDEHQEAVGEPTEAALINYAKEQNLLKPDLDKVEQRINEAPFDSIRKKMSTIHKTSQGIVQYTKGAPDEILKVCNFYFDNGKVVTLTEEKRNEILKQNKEMASHALRVLAASFKTYEAEPQFNEASEIEKDLVFIGLVGMIDPIRPEVKLAIENCKAAGIKAIMITGDHKDTAVAIAKQLQIITDEKEAITGNELNNMSDEELFAKLETIAVYARVQPEHKVRIVQAWKKKEKITAMTGDGVNDAPSIKIADIGVGMGITGTDVTKNVADMILADDNFATIVKAVEEGRKIYDNIRKAIQFLLSSNLSEVISVFTATILGFTILKPAHILWINLITDSLPALALGMEEAEGDSMKRPPRSSKAGIFSDGVGIDVIYQGFVVSILTVAAYLLGHYIESGVFEFKTSADGITMAFLTMSMAEIFQSFNMRSRRKSIFTLKTHNKYLYLAMVLALLLTTSVIYIPFLAKLFSFSSISFKEYIIALGLAVLVIPIVEIVKLFQRKFAKAK